jgi:hypothetical protein
MGHQLGLLSKALRYDEANVSIVVKLADGHG